MCRSATVGNKEKSYLGDTNLVETSQIPKKFILAYILGARIKILMIMVKISFLKINRRIYSLRLRGKNKESQSRSIKHQSTYSCSII